MNKNALNLPILTSLVIGNMIGTGVYLLPASLASFGSISLLSWVFTSIGAIFLALTFTRLNKRFPKTGGPYVYCKQAYGPFVGFVIAYSYWMSNLISIAGVCVASVGYLGYLIPYLNANAPLYQPKLILLIELFVVWFFTLINVVGIHAAGMVQLVLTIIKLLPLFFIIFFGLEHIDWQHYSPFVVGDKTPLATMTSAATLTFWAYIGLETATVPAENTKGPRDVYIATVFGVVVTGLIYILCSFVVIGLMPHYSLMYSQFPLAQAGVMLFGESAAIVIALCAFISGLGSLNATTLVQGQIVFAGARDKIFPAIFSKLSKNDAPVNGQLFSAILITILLIVTSSTSLLKQFSKIILYAGVTTLFTYLLCALAEIKFTLKLNWKKCFIPIMAVLYAGWMLTSFKIKTLIVTSGIIFLALPVYFFVKKDKKESQ